ncbi:ATP-dependent DNA helicase pfh1-like [Homalodisca vitripennis]|uniref:ATP-dependent DNA helicase pfh1-like n=1 Tax=Homalodisca vitripennis TaxID=197043 RepID=UPI001EEB89AB|nr:ATP-dependent DNA helicase pfh1-like [Homalodisca vitripennis]
MKLTLIDIDRSLRQQGSCLKDHGLPYVEDDTTELGRELLNYGENLQRTIVEDWVPKLSPDQRRVFEYVRSLLLNPRDRRTSRIIFLDGPGGYGKTSLIRVILAYVRGCRQVALAVASSGIAARNMDGGTTAHSMFRLPLDLGHGTGVWNITNGSQRAELIRAAQLIVFDEAPMAHRYIFEMIDRSLRDLMNSSVPFGNKIFICSGDFRQIAPVVEKARTHQLMSRRERESLIPLTGVRCLTSLADLITDVFPPGVLRDPDLCARRAILSTLNVNVKEINGRILDLMDGRIHELRSADTVDREDDDGLDVDVKSPQPGHWFAFAEGSPLRVCRRQFPLMLAYCMTGHKSQGQTIEYVGVDLRTDCFTHGQLYVLLSRVRRPDDIVVLVPDDRIVEGVAYAKNIVYDELLLNTD